MVRMFVRHSVSDYKVWRKAYDDFREKLEEAGGSGRKVYRSVDDANDITAWHDFGTIEEARAFATSSDLREAMTNAGVIGPPTIWFAEKT